MNPKNYIIEYMKPDKLMLELRYDVACARAEGVELIRLELSPSDVSARGRLLTTTLRKLAVLRREGVVQFYASQKDFSENTTESVYLLNKYPDIAKDTALESESGERIVFVRI